MSLPVRFFAAAHACIPSSCSTDLLSWELVPFFFWCAAVGEGQDGLETSARGAVRLQGSRERWKRAGAGKGRGWDEQWLGNVKLIGGRQVLCRGVHCTGGARSRAVGKGKMGQKGGYLSTGKQGCLLQWTKPTERERDGCGGRVVEAHSRQSSSLKSHWQVAAMFCIGSFSCVATAYTGGIQAHSSVQCSGSAGCPYHPFRDAQVRLMDNSGAALA